MKSFSATKYLKMAVKWLIIGFLLTWQGKAIVLNFHVGYATDFQLIDKKHDFL